MTAPPDRIFVNWDDREDGCCPAESDTSDHGKFFEPQSATEYIRADLHTAAIAAAEARGWEQGLREAAAYHENKIAWITEVIASNDEYAARTGRDARDSNVICYEKRAAHETHARAILALIPAKETPDE